MSIFGRGAGGSYRPLAAVAPTRYDVPTVSLVVARDAERARELARKSLGESLHHVAIEIRENDLLIGRVDRDNEYWLQPGDTELPLLPS
jgi:hypothetical protein